MNQANYRKEIRNKLCKISKFPNSISIRNSLAFWKFIKKLKITLKELKGINL